MTEPVRVCLLRRQDSAHEGGHQVIQSGFGVADGLDETQSRVGERIGARAPYHLRSRRFAKKLDLLRLPAELQPQFGFRRRSTIVFDERASHAEIENESVLAIERTENRT